MQPYILKKSPPLCGEIPVQRSKNASLPALAAALLTKDPVTLLNVPDLTDIDNMLALISSLGVTVSRELSSVTLCADTISAASFSPEHADRLRASVLLIGPLLARCGEARLLLPGGCAIGSRPLDQHIKGFCALGVRFSVEDDALIARCDNLRGTHIRLDSPSVGATENLLLISVMAQGETVLDNVAREPEITDLISLLNRMGARILGAGTTHLTIQGVPALHGASHTPISDRIAAGTYAMMTLATGGDVFLRGANPSHLSSVLHILSQIGAKIIPDTDGLRIRGAKLHPVSLFTAPYPGFPTDLQPPLVALLSTVPGESFVTERIFEDRFRYLPELRKMGANIFVEGGTAAVSGVPALRGASVEATDLRAGAALLLTGLCAEGETRLSGVPHLLRGYTNLERNLTGVGAPIVLPDP